MASQGEKEFTTELKKEFQARGHFFHKIADAPHLPGSGFRFDIKKPFDAFAVASGVPMALEIKHTTSIKAFGMGAFRPNQIEGLDAFSSAGGVSIVILNVRIPRESNFMFWWFWKHQKAAWERASTKAKDFDYMQDAVLGVREKIVGYDGKAKYQTRWQINQMLDDAFRVHLGTFHPRGALVEASASDS